MSENKIILSADDATAAPLVATIRAAVNGHGKYVKYAEAHNVTRENVKDHAVALATLAYPKAEPVQKKDGKRTTFGNAVQAAGNGLRAALVKVEGGEATVNLITREGAKADLADVIAAWEAAQK